MPNNTALSDMLLVRLIDGLKNESDRLACPWARTLLPIQQSGHETTIRCMNVFRRGRCFKEQ